jgi:hypothetical protein
MRNPRNPADCKHFPLCEHLEPLTGRLTNGLFDTYSRVLPIEAGSICNECDGFLGKEKSTTVGETTSTAETGISTFKVELKFGNITIREYILQDGDTRFIGRGQENHIVINDSGVSRNHACLNYLGDQLFIWDQGSKHGTLVNGAPVICANLDNGDVVSIGVNHKLRVSITTKHSEGTVSAFFDRGRNLMTTT